MAYVPQSRHTVIFLSPLSIVAESRPGNVRNSCSQVSIVLVSPPIVFVPLHSRSDEWKRHRSGTARFFSDSEFCGSVVALTHELMLPTARHRLASHA